MALPEPIPAMTKKESKEFKKRLKRFTLTDAQRKLLEGAEELYKENSF